MRFSFDVGVQERHRVDFSFDPVWGGLHIDVDGVTVERRNLARLRPPVRRYTVPVGTWERHLVTTEQRRPTLFPAFRSRRYRIYIDGVLVQEYRGH